jgi:exopolyphosphatase/guanosine-5'-triphosphate,3'-diphosphate pyrophosphatase
MGRAAIDLGSNMAQLLIVLPTGEEKVFQDFTALGFQTAVTKKLSENSIHKTLEVLLNFKSILDNFNISTSEVVFYATEACRIALNRDIFFEKIKILGFNPILISAEHEAFLSSYAVLKDQNQIDNYVSLDIGGASTEIVLLNVQKKISHFVSLKVGTLLATDLKESNEYESFFKNLIKQQTKQLEMFRNKDLICTRGTMTTIFNLVLNNHSQIEYSYPSKSLLAKEILGSLNIISQFSNDELEKSYPYIKPRLKTLAGAILVVQSLISYLKPEKIILSDRGLVHAALDLIDINQN